MTLVYCFPIFLHLNLFQKFFPQEVRVTKMLSIKVSKFGDPDGIPNRVIKDFAYGLADHVCHILKTSLHTGEFPDIWKDALITPVPKVPSVSCENLLRPISLTAVCLKSLKILW